MENKKTILQQLSDKILELDAQLDGLKGVAANASADVKKEYEKLMKDLKAKKADAEVKYKKFNDSSDDGWEELKLGAEKAFNDLSDAFMKAKAKFNQK